MRKLRLDQSLCISLIGEAGSLDLSIPRDLLWQRKVSFTLILRRQNKLTQQEGVVGLNATTQCFWTAPYPAMLREIGENGWKKAPVTCDILRASTPAKISRLDEKFKLYCIPFFQDEISLCLKIWRCKGLPAVRMEPPLLTLQNSFHYRDSSNSSSSPPLTTPL